MTQCLGHRDHSRNAGFQDYTEPETGLGTMCEQVRTETIRVRANNAPLSVQSKVIAEISPSNAGIFDHSREEMRKLVLEQRTD